MLKKIISLALSLSFLISASLTTYGTTVYASSTDSDSAESSKIDYTTGTPWLNSDLDGNVTKDTKASLKDNFCLYVNKDKILNLEIQEGYSSAGTLFDLNQKNTENTKNMFLGDAPTSHDGKLAYDLFWLMMDWDTRNKQGVEPLKHITDMIDNINSTNELSKYLLNAKSNEQFAALWHFASDVDLSDSSKRILFVSNSDLLLGDSAEYQKLTDYGEIKKNAVLELTEKMLSKLGYSGDEIKQKIDNCFEFETEIAGTISTTEQQKSPDFFSKIYNIYTYDELKDLQGNLPILELMEKSGYPKDEVYMVFAPDYIKKLNEMYTDNNLALIKDYLIVHNAIICAELLDKECYEWTIQYSNALSGAQGRLPDEDLFSKSVSGILSMQVGRLYSDTYLKAEDKERITTIIEEEKEAYKNIITSADFLSDETKEKALEKLAAIKLQVLYPDDWSKYETNDLNFKSADDGGTLFDAIASITEYEIKQNATEHTKPIDTDKWFSPPNIVNCQYYLNNNTVYIYGAFCQGNMYNSDMSDEELYGKLGWVIGHELSHAFDSKGAQFDKDGNMADWWTPEDYEAFKKRNEKLAAYYNNMHPWEGQDFHGEILTSEAGADMAGLKVVLQIVKDKKDFDYDKFFHAICDVWLRKASLQNSYQQIENEHPMAYLRINCTLQQYDEFLDFYDIKEGDGMYLAPEDRVNIW